MVFHVKEAFVCLLRAVVYFGSLSTLIIADSCREIPTPIALKTRQNIVYIAMVVVYIFHGLRWPVFNS